MSDILDGFLFGVVVGGLVLSVAVNVFLYFMLPGTIEGIVEGFLSNIGLKGKNQQGGRKQEGLLGLLETPLGQAIAGRVLSSGGPAAQVAAPVAAQGIKSIWKR